MEAMNHVAKEERRNVHAVMVPCPLPSHLNSMLHFAKALISCHGFRITLVTNEYLYTRLQQHDLSGYADLLHLAWVDNGLSPQDFDYSNPASKWVEFIKGCENMRAPLQTLIESLSSSRSVSYVIYGSFFPWAHHVAMELGIPSMFFWTQSLAVFSLYYHRSLLVSNGFYPYKGIPADENAELISYIPGIPPLHPARLPGFLQVGDPSHIAFSVIDVQFATLNECKAVIFNSFHELEKEAVEALQGKPFSVFMVGPLLGTIGYGGDATGMIKGANVVESVSRPSQQMQGISSESYGNPDRGDANFVAKDKDSECLRWLGTQKKHSVVYISFGTVVSPSKEDMAGIASGLCALKQPFLWVIRLSSSIHSIAEILPENFLEETKEYGMIVSWAPQIEVLTHSSVGAFLTHCGWNSVLESVSMGVPMITCPGGTDQPTSCMYVVDVWRVGMELKRNNDGNIDHDKFEKVLRCMIQEEDGHDMRRRACNLRDAAKTALACGSSLLDFHKVAQLLRTPLVH